MKSEALFMGIKKLNLPERYNQQTGEKYNAVNGTAYQFTANEWSGTIQEAKSRTYSQLIKDSEDVPAELLNLKLGEMCQIRVEDVTGFNCEFLQKVK